jgi:hypothetical protein
MTDESWDDHVALLRAMLTGDDATYQRLSADLERRGDSDRFGVLLSIAFTLALRRHFRAGYSAADVIRLAGRIRADSEEAASQIDPAGAERLIRAALGEPGLADSIDDLTKGGTQAVGLVLLVGDDQPDGGQLDAFLAEAQHQAARFLSPA